MYNPKVLSLHVFPIIQFAPNSIVSSIEVHLPNLQPGPVHVIELDLLECRATQLQAPNFYRSFTLEIFTNLIPNLLLSTR